MDDQNVRIAAQNGHEPGVAEHVPGVEPTPSQPDPDPGDVDGRAAKTRSSASAAKRSLKSKRVAKTRSEGSPRGGSAGRTESTGARSRSRKSGGAKRSFPAATFETALEIPTAIQQFSAGQPVRRVTLFDHLGKSPDSGASRQLISNSSRYGLTSGSHHSEHLELTEDGRLATSPEASAHDRLRARFRLAIESIEPFKALYERFSDGKVPAAAVMRDFLVDGGTPQDEVQECVETFVVNVKFLGLLRTLSGAERFLTLEHALDELPRGAGNESMHARGALRPADTDQAGSGVAWDRLCFYITPIGDEESEDRQHADLFLGSVVEPAVEELGLQVVRADQIEQPGMITTQSLEHILKARLVIADLSFLNPNVFYELCLGHVSGKPTVQIIRTSDRIPFDVNQVRTIRLDTTDLYSFVPRLETYKTEIATQARQALEGTAPADNPLTIFYPDLRSALAASE